MTETMRDTIDGAWQAQAANDAVRDIFSAATLEGLKFPPVRYVIDDYLPEGLTILAGKPKIGKSWLSLGFGIAVARGSNAMGDIPTEAGDVLFLALEDNARRLQSRLNKMIPEGRWPSRLEISTEWPRLDAGGLEKIQEWIDGKDAPRMIVIDTLARVRQQAGRNDSTYEADYAALTGLHRIAKSAGIAVVAVHHVRKMDADDPLDTVSGTTGLTGAADTTLVLTRGQAEADAILYGRGRDIEEIETAMKFESATGAWLILGDADDYRRTKERQQIIDVLRNADEPMGPRDIAAATEQPEANVRRMLSRLVSDEEIKKTGRGQYEAL